MLTIVPTPIGNLKDITLRALEVLKSVDGIICEDSRRTSILLNHYSIKKPLTVVNDYNEIKIVSRIIDQLTLGQNLALVSDAGTPLISDPGFKLVRQCLKNNIVVDSLPGAFAGVVALTLSGLPTDKFMFLGYFPDKASHRLKTFQNIQAISQIIPTTFIAYISPFKTVKTLEEMAQVWSDLPITMASELTKIHQAVQTKSIQDWIAKFKSQSAKGEWVMIFHPD